MRATLLRPLQERLPISHRRAQKQYLQSVNKKPQRNKNSLRFLICRRRAADGCKKSESDLALFASALGMRLYRKFPIR